MLENLFHIVNSNESFYQHFECRAAKCDDATADSASAAEVREGVHITIPKNSLQKSQNTHETKTKMAVTKSMKSKALSESKDEGLDKKKKTPSLEQEMNLARRACWCNSNNGEEVVDSEKQQQHECCENCFKRNTTKTTDDIAKDSKLETTTVLNGAKIIFSQNINTNTTTTTKTSTTTTTYNRNTMHSDLGKSSKTTATTNPTTNSFLSKRKNILKHNKNQDTPVEEGKDHNSVNTLSSSPAVTLNPLVSVTTTSSLKASLRDILLRIWLAFVAFCDRNTIKRNDPRFEVYRQQQTTVSTSNSTSSSAASSSKDTDNKSKKPGQFKFKLLTSKKVIFLLLVCFFFSCINRIEARPNTNGVDVSGNAVADASAIGAGLGTPSENGNTVTSGKGNVSRIFVVILFIYLQKN